MSEVTQSLSFLLAIRLILGILSQKNNEATKLIKISQLN